MRVHASSPTRNATLLAVILSLVYGCAAVPTQALAQTVDRSEESAQHPELQILDLPFRATDPRFLDETRRSQQDRNPAFGAAPASPAPDTTRRDFHVVCDVDGDGFRDFVANEFYQHRSRIRTYSGADGRPLWYQENMVVAHPPLVEMERPGKDPERPDNVWPLIDSNGDGTCDLAAYGYLTSQAAVPRLGTPTLTNFTGLLRVLDGKTGAPVWSRPIHSDQIDLETLRARGTFADTPFLRQAVALNFPTELVAYATPSGPRLLFKTTDVYSTAARLPDDTPTRFVTQDASVVEHLYSIDATQGKVLWKRELGNATQSRWTDLTWITGLADLVGNDQPEIVLDQYRLQNPRATEARPTLFPLLNQTVNEPPYRFGRGMSVMALRGEDGTTAWSTEVLREGTIRARAQEDSFEVLAWTAAQIVDDLNGDNRPDPVALYLTREADHRKTPNGRFLTHIHPLDGTTGTRIFGEQDARVQGWGSVATLAPGLLAVGTVDPPTAANPYARFPSKEARITVLEDDGTPRWGFEGSWIQNDALSYDMTLDQFKRRLAPFDWTGDGVLDLVTPSQTSAPAALQILLSTMNHSYQVLDGTNGEPIHAFSGWGANGAIMDCPEYDGALTVFSGHSRRLDMSRVEPSEGRTSWQTPGWLDATLARAASSGTDLTALEGHCEVDGSGNTYFAINAAMTSLQRGHEVLSIMGRIDASGSLAWSSPTFSSPGPIRALTDASAEPAIADWRPQAFTALAAAFAGALVGVAIGIRWRRPFASLLILGLLGTAAWTPILDAPVAAMADVTLPHPAPGTQPIAQPYDSATALPIRIPASAHDAVEQVAEHLRGMGFQAPAAAASFDENKTISFVHQTGDIDQDGVDDFLLDTYCLDCRDFPGLEDPVFWVQSQVRNWRICESGHEINLRSGRDGHSIWNKSIVEDDLLFPAACTGHFVLGVVPTTPGQSGILMYRYSILYAYPTGIAAWVTHTFYVLNITDARPVWSQAFDGRLADTNPPPPQQRVRVADTIIVNPLLQMPSLRHPAVGMQQQATLLLEAVGFQRVYSNTTEPDGIVLDERVRLAEASYPDHWAARLDLATGKILWRRSTFGPTPGVSVEPVATRWRYTEHPWDAPGNIFANYWKGAGCCYDVTGDGVSDLVYHTTEWAAFPTTNLNGPVLQSSRLLTFDGSTGEPVFETPLYLDSKSRSETVTVQPIGDTNGDGAPDLLIHQVRKEYAFEHAMSLRSGKDGSELWRLAGPHEKRAWVIGDADHDGANDFVMLAWLRHPSLRADSDGPSTNVTRQPLQVRSGKDGTLLWQTTTIAAPLDIIAGFRTFEVNGFPDINGDGIGDILVDDPVYLRDLNVVHRQRLLSGADGSPLLSYVAGGSFALTVPLGDVTSDGRDDLGLLSGDLVDLWFSAIDGSDGQALWSRRITQVPLTHFTTAEPLVHAFVLREMEGRPFGLFLNLHLQVSRRYYVDALFLDGEPGQLQEIASRHTYPLLSNLAPESGRSLWSYPALYSSDLNVSHPGATLASRVLGAALHKDPPPILLGTAALAPSTPWVALGSFLAACLAGFVAARRLRH